jgi:hypothetical protein
VTTVAGKRTAARIHLDHLCPVLLLNSRMGGCRAVAQTIRKIVVCRPSDEYSRCRVMAQDSRQIVVCRPFLHSPLLTCACSRPGRTFPRGGGGPRRGDERGEAAGGGKSARSIHRRFRRGWPSGVSMRPRSKRRGNACQPWSTSARRTGWRGLQTPGLRVTVARGCGCLSRSETSVAGAGVRRPPPSLPERPAGRERRRGDGSADDRRSSRDISR